jgi:multiple sugar transport system ATP-binding protein
MANVSMRKVNKVYRSGKEEVQAVIDLDMEVKDGELVALLGPSGCGKTSTLRMIAGLEEITSGGIYFDEKRINNLEPKDRNVAMAFESYSLYPHMTVYKNIKYPLDVLKLQEKDKDKKVRDIAHVFDIETFLFKRPPQLSGGQQQRVSLARALVRNPEIFLLDEPISHSDAHLRFQMRNQIKKLHYQLSATMIYVTHDQIDALSMADRIAVMNFARLQQIGTRNELYDDPVNKFVAGFVGEPRINFFNCEMKGENGGIGLRVEGSKDLSFSADASETSTIKRSNLAKTVVGIRPQYISIERRSKNDTEVEGEIVLTEFIGEKVLTTIRNGIVEFALLTPTRKRLKEGSVLKVYIPRKSVLVFNPSTEERIR